MSERSPPPATTFSPSMTAASSSSPPSPPRRRVHAGTTPHKKRGARSGRSSLGGDAGMPVVVVVDDKENRLNSSSSAAAAVAQNHNGGNQNHNPNSSEEEDFPVKSNSKSSSSSLLPGIPTSVAPMPSSDNEDDDDATTNLAEDGLGGEMDDGRRDAADQDFQDQDDDDDDNKDRSLSMVLSPDGSQQTLSTAGRMASAHHHQQQQQEGSGGGGQDDLDGSGNGGGMVLLDHGDLLDLSGVSSITGGSGSVTDGASLGGGGGGGGGYTPGPTPTNGRTSTSTGKGKGTTTTAGGGSGRLSLSSAKSSGTGGTSSLLMGMNFLSPSTAAATTPGGGGGATGGAGGSGSSRTNQARPSNGGGAGRSSRFSLGSLSASTGASASVATPVPSAGGGTGSGRRSATKSGGPKSGGRRHSTASARSSLPSTPGFASPPRLSRPNFLLSPPPPASAIIANANAASTTPCGDNAQGSSSSSRVESVLRMQQEAENDADNGNVEKVVAAIAQGSATAALDSDEREGDGVCVNDIVVEEETKGGHDQDDKDDIVDDESSSSSLDEDMFLPNASSSVDPSDDDQGGTKEDVMEEEPNTANDNTDGTPTSLDNAPIAATAEPSGKDGEDQVFASNQGDDEDDYGDANSTERVVSELAHDVPTIPEGVEDVNSSSDEEDKVQNAAPVGDCLDSYDVDDMPLPDDDNVDDEYGHDEDDAQSSPTRPTVLDHADIDPTPTRPSGTTPSAALPAAQNVLAELPTDTDLLAAALQRSVTKTPRAVSKKKTAACPSPVAAATPVPGLPFGEVRVGEAPIFSPLSFHGGTMTTTASATTSSSSSSAGESTESSGRYFVASAGLGTTNDDDKNRRSNGLGRVRKARPSVGGASRPGRTSIGGAGRRRAGAAASASATATAGDGIGILGILGMLGAAPTSGQEPLIEHKDEDDCDNSGSKSTTTKEDASAPSTSEQSAPEDSTAYVAPSPLEVEPKELMNERNMANGENESHVVNGGNDSMPKVLASPKSESTTNHDVAPEPSVGGSLAQSPNSMEEPLHNDSEEDASSSSTGSSDGDSANGSDDETESEVSSRSSSSDDVSIVLPNRKNKQGGRRRNIQASDEDSDVSFKESSSSDDAKDDDDEEGDVLVYDDDKGDDGSYTIDSDEDVEDDDDVLIYESDESSVGAKPKKKSGSSRAFRRNVKPKARARVVESEDDSDGSIESECESVVNLEKSLAAVSIAASRSNEDSILEAEVVDDDESADDVSAPSEESILRAADELFVAADKENITVRDICNAIEDRFDLTLEKPTKKVIKAHLIALINEEIQPIVGDDAIASSSGSGSLGDLEDAPESKNRNRRRGGLQSSSAAAEPMAVTLASAASNEGSTASSSRSLGTRKGSVRRGKWSRGAQLGVGSFGVVHMGMNQRNGQMMAVKTMNLPEDDDEGVLTDHEREIHLMRALDHPNIVRYIGCERDQKRSTLAIFQEWVPGGSISSLLRKFGPFPLPVIRKYLYQICTGLAYLHANDIIHRDIKGSNILVTDEGVCKLADFGASRRLRSSSDNSISAGSEGQDDMVQSLTMRGTPYFMAPEVFEERYGTKSDIWSFGGVAFQMCSGLAPWKASGVRNPYELIRLLKESDDVPELPKNIDPKLEHLIRACFQRDPSRRPSAETLLQDPFFDVDECSTVFSGESSSFGMKSPSARKAAKKQFSSPASNHKEASYHFPAEYDEKEWPKWAKGKKNSGDSDSKNPFGRR